MGKRTPVCAPMPTQLGPPEPLALSATAITLEKLREEWTAPLRAELKKVREERLEAIKAFYDLEALIDTASRWLNDSTKWEGDDHLEPQFQALRERVALLGRSLNESEEQEKKP